MSKFLRDNATMIALIFFGVLLSLLPLLSGTFPALKGLEVFATPRNLTNIALQVTTVGIIAVGMTMVILIAGIDLSVGRLFGLAGIVATWIMHQGTTAWVAVPLTLLGGLAVGVWNGVWIARWRIPAFIITLGMMTIAHGTALSISGGSSIPVNDEAYYVIGNDSVPQGVSIAVLAVLWLLFLYRVVDDVRQRRRYQLEVSKLEKGIEVGVATAGLGLAIWVFGFYRGIPVSVAIFALVAMAGAFTLRNTRFGRRLYAMGGNEEAARLSGINIRATTIAVYGVVGGLAALAGIVGSSRLNGASPNDGTMLELDVIAAVVIGGTSLTGGVGTVGGSVIGAFLIGVLNNGMTLLGIPTFFQNIIKGFIIILAALFDALSKRKKS
ncbi:sugar ABC transporter permease [Haliangium sp.]|uniref:sugar ABC transporter permease n=1 Tax=Haliangium sp. TaxID=2663208 RepID=UPI003D1446A2